MNSEKEDKMLFQTLDDKSECVGIYTNGELIFDSEKFPTNLTATWKYAPYLQGMDVEFASLYLEGEKIKDHLPEYLLEDWEDVSKKISSFKRSLNISKVNTSENCFFDLVPQRFLIDYCEIKNKITEHVLKTIKRPERYEFHRHMAQMLSTISQHRVNLDRRLITSLSRTPKYKNQAEALLTMDPFVKYNQFGTKTGRLTTLPNSLPILTLNKVFRSAIKPQNDYYVELDFNGAEVRTLLGLLGEEQPSVDVHTFHLERVFQGVKSRDEAKVLFFSWLYGSKKAAQNPDAQRLASFYQVDSLLDQYWREGTIITPYGKRIPQTTRHHAINYLVQSTAAELALKQALKINYLLGTKNCKSHVAFLVHDAIVIDMCHDDAGLLETVKHLMGSTNFGEFRVNLSRGKNLGSLKEFSCG